MAESYLTKQISSLCADLATPGKQRSIRRKDMAFARAEMMSDPFLLAASGNPFNIGKRKRKVKKKPEPDGPLQFGDPAYVAPDAPPLNQETAITPLEYMLRIINDPSQPAARRDRLAIQALPFMHKKISAPGAPTELLFGKGGKIAERKQQALTSQQGTAWETVLDASTSEIVGAQIPRG